MKKSSVIELVRTKMYQLLLNLVANSTVLCAEQSVCFSCKQSKTYHLSAMKIHQANCAVCFMFVHAYVHMCMNCIILLRLNFRYWMKNELNMFLICHLRCAFEDI